MGLEQRVAILGSNGNRCSCVGRSFFKESCLVPGWDAVCLLQAYPEHGRRHRMSFCRKMLPSLRHHHSFHFLFVPPHTSGSHCRSKPRTKRCPFRSEAGWFCRPKCSAHGIRWHDALRAVFHGCPVEYAIRCAYACAYAYAISLFYATICQ